MHIRFEGRPSLPDLVQRLSAIVEQLGGSGVTGVDSVELNFEPYTGNRPAKLRAPGGGAADVICVSADGSRVYSLVELCDLRAEGEP